MTAKWTAAARAREALRPVPLFTDPYAAALAGLEGPALLQQGEETVAGLDDAIFAIRTRFFDDYLAAATDQGIRQVVVLAAGLDVRPYRLDWPAGSVWFECDRAEVLAHKAAGLARAGAVANCRVRPIATDLAGDWLPDLEGAGFDRSAPTAWLAEGFLCYLPPEAVHRLLRAVAGIAAPGSRLGLDVVTAAFATSPHTASWMAHLRAIGAPWRFFCDAPDRLLEEMGWSAQVTQAGDPAAHFGRWPFPTTPRTVPNAWPTNLFAIAKRT